MTVWPEHNHEVQCAETGTAWDLTVSLPARHAKLTDPPVIVAMDGDWIYGTLRDATRIMSMPREAPEAVVVGVSMRADSQRDHSHQRARWFTPTAFVPPPETGVRDVDASWSGHAATTIALLRDQILPLIEHNYTSGERWYVGHSFTGLFGLRMLFDQPELFSKWLLASPSIWWDSRAILRWESDWADSHDDLNATVFVSVGGDEMAGEYAMADNVAELVSRLQERSYAGLTLHHKVLSGETHFSTIGPAISAGLRALF